MSAAAAARTLAAAKPAVAASAASRLLQRKCACGSASASLTGECGECKKKPLQTRLTIGASDDPLELEADRVAAQVLNAPERDAVGNSPPHIQRYTGHATAEAASAPASVDCVLAASGRPLEPTLRQDMARHFGHDFSRVRLHDDADAARSARDVHADAYTVGLDLVFGAASYAPGTREGLRLIAHELTHVVQQSGGGGGGLGIESIGEARGTRIQRGGKKGPTTKAHSCGGWTCAPMSDCPNPDGKSAASATPSSNWSLTANLDLDVPTADEIVSGGDVGHAFVEFNESNGDKYTYGHYPGKAASPDPMFKPQVPGCSVHPDTTHSACVDMEIHYSLTDAEYKKALSFAQAWCVAGQPYHVLTNNCTTFVDKVVGVAGKTLPSSRGSVGHGTYNADNPNTLFDANLSQADNATWRQRVNGDFNGHYDASGTKTTFSAFELKTDDKFAVAGKYSYVGSTGDNVDGTLDGRLVFDVDAATKAVVASVKFDWTEPGGSGKGAWIVSTAGDLKGNWGRGTAASGAGGWELAKVP